MADEESGQDRSEEATPERRDEFRERGEVAVSRELTAVFILAATIAYLASDFGRLLVLSKSLLSAQLLRLTKQPLGVDSVLIYGGGIWLQALKIIIPIGLVTAISAIAITLAQTRLNVSWERVSPKFERMNPLTGLKRMVDLHAVGGVFKSVLKMCAVFIMSYIILRGEWSHVPALMFFPILDAWQYWGQITKSLIWAVVFLSMAIAAGDFFYAFIDYESRIKMTKQEVKEEYKKRETDPHVKGRMRRMQREMLAVKTVASTRTATVVITNPTHYAIAIKYIAGQRAPKVVAKGMDFMALRMREVAKESGVPIVENPPLARALYKAIEVGHDVPESLWTAVSEVIRYVIRLKGWGYVRDQEMES